MSDKVGLYKWKHLTHFTSFHFTCESYCHLEIMASSSSYGSKYMRDGFSSSSPSDYEILEQLFVDMDKQRRCAFACAIGVAKSFHMFNANELEEGEGQLMDP